MEVRSNISPSLSEVALLGFAHRSIRLSRRHIPTNRAPRKRFPASLRTLGDRIRAKRFEKALSTRQLAEMAGVTVAEVNAWESDAAVPSGAILETLSAILGFGTPSQDDEAHSGPAVGNLQRKSSANAAF